MRTALHINARFRVNAPPLPGNRKPGLVPVFFDKHLSWKWEWAKAMYDTAQEMGFAFMAGSSVPVVPRLPSVDLPLGVELEEGRIAGKADVLSR